MHCRAAGAIHLRLAFYVCSWEYSLARFWLSFQYVCCWVLTEGLSAEEGVSVLMPQLVCSSLSGYLRTHKGRSIRQEHFLCAPLSWFSAQYTVKPDGPPSQLKARVPFAHALQPSTYHCITWKRSMWECKCKNQLYQILKAFYPAKSHWTKSVISDWGKTQYRTLIFAAYFLLHILPAAHSTQVSPLVKNRISSGWELVWHRQSLVVWKGNSG